MKRRYSISVDSCIHNCWKFNNSYWMDSSARLPSSSGILSLKLTSKYSEKLQERHIKCNCFDIFKEEGYKPAGHVENWIFHLTGCASFAVLITVE